MPFPTFATIDEMYNFLHDHAIGGPDFAVVGMVPRWTSEGYMVMGAVENSSTRVRDLRIRYPRSDFKLISDIYPVLALDAVTDQSKFKEQQDLYIIFNDELLAKGEDALSSAFRELQRVRNVESLYQLGHLDPIVLCGTFSEDFAVHLVNHIKRDLQSSRTTSPPVRHPGYMKVRVPWYSEFFLENFPYSNIEFPEKEKIREKYDQVEFDHWVHGKPFPSWYFF